MRAARSATVVDALHSRWAWSAVAIASRRASSLMVGYSLTVSPVDGSTTAYRVMWRLAPLVMKSAGPFIYHTWAICAGARLGEACAGPQQSVGLSQRVARRLAPPFFDRTAPRSRAAFPFALCFRRPVSLPTISNTRAPMRSSAPSARSRRELLGIWSLPQSLRFPADKQLRDDDTIGSPADRERVRLDRHRLHRIGRGRLPRPELPHHRHLRQAGAAEHRRPGRPHRQQPGIRALAHQQPDH